MPELNAAQKAWATRRARAAAAAGFVPSAATTLSAPQVKSAAAAMPDVMRRLDLPVVDLFIEEEAFGRIVGYGRRRFIVLSADDRRVSLLSAAQLAELQVPRLTFDRFAKPARGSSAKTLAAIIKRNLTERLRLWPDETAAITACAERGLAALKVRK
jgi:hypothetical protein